jgi:hypothetical protein
VTEVVRQERHYTAHPGTQLTDPPAGIETPAAFDALSCEGRSVSTYLSTVTHDSANLTRGYSSLEQSLELLLGPRDDGSAFASDESRRIAWRLHSAELMLLVQPGARPWAWWEYDAPEPARPRESELSYLARWGFLTEAELASLAQGAVQRASHATRNP